MSRRHTGRAARTAPPQRRQVKRQAQLTPATALGSGAVEAYAARAGIGREAFVDGLQPVLTAEQVAKAVVHVAGDPDAGAEYRLDGAGLHLIP
jgi:hypothetical protein